MKIKNIYIGDFGIYNNQHLRNISPGINVIGGPNRSGKTTFMKILRYLGYGFPRDGSLPPATEKYHVEADIENREENYRLSINGYATPSLSSSDEKRPEFTASELYGNLDHFTYHQLFTISLDELQSISRVTGGNQERERLYSVLLGAGLSQLVELPQIASEYMQRAKNIGGECGDPEVYDFKAYGERIADLQKEKKQALKQIDRFIANKEKIGEYQEQQQELREEMSVREKKSVRLDLLKNSYEDCSHLRELNRKRKDHKGEKLSRENYSQEKFRQAQEYRQDYRQIGKEFEKKEKEFLGLVGEDEAQKTKEALLERRKKLAEHFSLLAGYREKVKNYRKRKEELTDKFNRLRDNLRETNSTYEEPDEIADLRTDKIERTRLNEEVDRLQELNTKLKNAKKERAELKNRREQLQERLQDTGVADSGKVLRNSVYFLFSSVLSGALLAFWRSIPGVILAGGGVILSMLYYSSRRPEVVARENKRQELEQELQKAKDRLERTGGRIQDLKKRKEESEKVVEEYREILGLPPEASPEMVRENFRTLAELKRRYRELSREKKVLNGRRQDIINELSGIWDLLTNLPGQRLFPEKKEVIKHSQELFSALERVKGHLDCARKLREAGLKKKDLEQEIMNFLQEYSSDFDGEKDNLPEALSLYIQRAEKFAEYRKLQEEYLAVKSKLLGKLESSDRFKGALLATSAGKEDSSEESRLLEIFLELYDDFTSREEVMKEYKENSRLLKKLKQESEEISERLSKLREENKRLASPEKIEKVHLRINKARSKLRSLAERYAVNRGVSFILEKVRDRVISRARDDLLQPAGEILKEITCGDYEKVEPPEDLEATDFVTIPSSGSKQVSAVLSRGTREQLFLAVRISRIKEIEPSLPVIIDDSLVNYDCSHLRQAVSVLSRLGESHQIFVLTCHPQLVEFFLGEDTEATYWQLENGKFISVTGEELISCLSV
ncbi:MAG: AAA family ATPase [Bacillota bacterium]